MPKKVWVVWSEFGEYEQRSEQTHGVFVTRELAEAHAEQFRAEREDWDVRVIEEEVLTKVPTNVPYIRWAAHIQPDGEESRGLGWERRSVLRTFSNEIAPATGRLGKWSGDRAPDLHIEVIGSDEEAVAAEYARLLAEARHQLGEAK